MKGQEIFVKSGHNHEPGNTTRRPRKIFKIEKVEKQEEQETELFEIIQI